MARKKGEEEKDNFVKIDFGATLPKIEIITNEFDVEGVIQTLKRIKTELLWEFLPSRERENIIIG